MTRNPSRKFKFSTWILINLHKKLSIQIRMKVIQLQANSTYNLDEVIVGCMQKDVTCQKLLYKEYAPKILTTCRRYEMPHFGAMDILQETFLIVFDKIKQYDPQRGALVTWIKRIAINIALKTIRDQKIKISELDYSYIVVDESEEQEDVELISEEYILAIIKELPNGYRTIFNMYEIDGYKHKEIAAELGISVQTSKSQLSKAKKMIRSKLSVFKRGIK